MTNYETANMTSPAEMQSPDIEMPEEQQPVITNDNLAEKMSQEKLDALGDTCRQGFDTDQATCKEWLDSLQDWLDLAQQIVEKKSFPWPDASNVKYPLLTTAAMQFSARAYPSLVPSNGKVVKGMVIGKDPTGEKLKRADRVATYISWQLLYDMDNWEAEMDQLLMTLSIVGCMHKKTWYDPDTEQINSYVISPNNLIINHWTRDLEDSERISEIIEMSPRKVQEKQNKKLYLKVDLGTPVPMNLEGMQDADDTTVPYTIIEQHTFYDYDGDGYPEPVIVTFEYTTKKVLRVSRRFYLDDVETDDKGKVVKIEPLQMYTKFPFIPNPDGGYYTIGFGMLLGPINESVNTVINQLIDAGTVNNLQSGFIGKAIKLKMGDQKLSPGEWKPVNATGDDLRKQIVPLPAKEPSKVLLELMTALVTSGKELASVAEIFVGKMPGQNTPATTTMASIEQGMKVFTAVYKRVYRALGKEFKKIMELNEHYLDPNTYAMVLDEELNPSDFSDDDYDICPAADPSAVTQSERLMKAQALVELLPLIPGLLDPIEVISRVLEAQEQPNWQKLFSQQVQQTGQLPPPQPDPKLMAIQAKMEADQRKNQLNAVGKAQDMELKGRDHQMQMMMKAQEHAQSMQMKKEELLQKAAGDIALNNVFASTARAKGQQELVNTQAKHEQTMQQMKEKQSLQKRNGTNGGSAGERGRSRRSSRRR